MRNRLVVLFILIAMVISTNSQAVAQNRLERVDLLVLGGTIVTMDATRRVIDDGVNRRLRRAIRASRRIVGAVDGTFGSDAYLTRRHCDVRSDRSEGKNVSGIVFRIHKREEGMS